MAYTAEERREYERRYRQTDKYKIRRAQYEKSETRRASVNSRHQALRKTETYRQKRKTVDQTKRYRVRARVFGHYGMSCRCCGESDIFALVIDHVNGGGNAHRERLGCRGGYNFYLWLIRNGFPSGFRTLCHNCNLTREINGGTLPQWRFGIHSK